MPERIIVAMSGGVDSSVAAALLHEQGFDVIGVTLQLWGKDVCVSSGTRLCCSVRDAMDAKAVAKRLGIRHEVLELVEEPERPGNPRAEEERRGDDEEQAPRTAMMLPSFAFVP